MDISAIGEASNVLANQQLETNTKSNTVSMDDFYKLLVAQLKHQDPTKPMDSAQTITQMAQVSAAEASVSMKKSIDSQTTMANINTANMMLDKFVKYIDTESKEERVGKVEAVDFSGGEVTMTVDNVEISSAQVFALADDKISLESPSNPES